MQNNFFTVYKRFKFLVHMSTQINIQHVFKMSACFEPCTSRISGCFELFKCQVFRRHRHKILQQHQKTSAALRKNR